MVCIASRASNLIDDCTVVVDVGSGVLTSGPVSLFVTKTPPPIWRPCALAQSRKKVLSLRSGSRVPFVAGERNDRDPALEAFERNESVDTALGWNEDIRH